MSVRSVSPGSPSPFLGAALLLLPAFGLLAGGSGFANELARDRDPVVLTGADVSNLAGAPVDRVVAFRRDAAWQQVPVQVDERKVEDFGTIYGTTPSGYTVLTYADAGTFTGPLPPKPVARKTPAHEDLPATDAGPSTSPATAPTPPDGTEAGDGAPEEDVAESEPEERAEGEED